MSQAIYRKWRPSRFDDVIGQEHVTRTLQRAITSGRIGHAYLFCGPRGTGKTTTARLLAKAVNCLNEDSAERPCDNCRVCATINEGRFLDLIEIDAASNTGVDDIRELRDKINFAPSDGKYKVYIIDEVHMLSTAAFNALLKTLEEPPSHAIFVLATTEEHKVLATIKSRCQQHNFRLLSTPEIIGRLNWLSEKEQLTVEPEAMQLIAREGAGSLRDAESLLDQLVTAPGDTITLERTQQVLGTASIQAIGDLVTALITGNVPVGLSTIHEALQTGADARQFCRQVVSYLRQLVLVKIGGTQVPIDVSAETLKTMSAQAEQANQRTIIDALKKFNEAAMAPSNSWQPQLPLELALIESIAGPTVAPVQAPAAVKAAPTVAHRPQAAAAPAPTPVAKPAPPPVKKQAPAVQKPPVKKADPIKKEDVPAVVKTEVDAGGDSAEKNAAAPSSNITLHMVQSAWSDMNALVKKRDRNIPALLATSTPLAVEGATVVLGFNYGIMKEKFDSTPNASGIVSESLSTILDTTCLIRTVETSQYAPAQQSVSRDEVEKLANELGGVVRDTS